MGRSRGRLTTKIRALVEADIGAVGRGEIVQVRRADGARVLSGKDYADGLAVRQQGIAWRPAAPSRKPRPGG